jgi:hypothetical protein
VTQTQDSGATATPTTAMLLLHDLGPGTARVQSVVAQQDETLMQLEYANGLHVAVSVPDVPRRPYEVGHPSTAMRPLAVLIKNEPSALGCSVLSTSKDGPTRVPISLSEALALCDSGVHTVLRR